MPLDLITLALITHTAAGAPIVMDSTPELLNDLELSYSRPVPTLVQYYHYRSPYRYYYPGPGYRQPYWGIQRQGYWGPRWQHDLYWQFCSWRGRC